MIIEDNIEDQEWDEYDDDYYEEEEENLKYSQTINLEKSLKNSNDIQIEKTYITKESRYGK